MSAEQAPPVSHGSLPSATPSYSGKSQTPHESANRQGQGLGFPGPAEADLYRCVHCGFCLPNCPTYVETGMETASPRGRLALMKAVHESRIQITPRVEEHLELCVQCRACEAVCPSGVPFGRVMQAARDQIAATRPMSRGQRLARFAAFRIVLPHPWLLRSLAALLRVYQATGLQWLVREYRLLSLSPSLDRAERQLPNIGKFFSSSSVRRLSEGAAAPILPLGQGELAGVRSPRVALLTGCVMPVVYGRVHEATVRVLARNGCTVVAPKSQACCGALHAHSGDLDMARTLARKNIDAFLEAGVDAIVVNSAGCGAAMKDYGDLLKDDAAYADKAERFSTMVRDISQYLAALPLRPPEAKVDAVVTYQDSCHLAHAQRIKDAPRQVLRSVPGLRLAEMAGSDLCCGAGGVYSLTHNEMSMRLLDHKMEHVAETEAAILATSNPGCMMQLEAGLRRAGRTGRVVHVVELLDEAYGQK